MKTTCYACGTELLCIEGVSEEVATSWEDWDSFVASSAQLGVDMRPEDLTITYCPDCKCTTYMGPQITLEGEIASDP